MKHLLIAISCFISAHVLGQNEGKARLLLSPGNCNIYAFHDFLNIDKIRVYRLPANTLISTLTPDYGTVYPLRLTLSPADYRVAYSNNFGQRVSRRVHLGPGRTAAMRLCIDSLVAYPENTLDKLRDKDTLSIAYHTIGCFHDASSRIVITRTGAHLEAKLYDETKIPGDKTHNLIARRTKDLFLHVRTLTADDILQFIRFENELRKFTGTNGYCTTRDHYQVESKYFSGSFTDGGCNWNGFNALKRSWFGAD